jgi:hypothetical protein
MLILSRIYQLRKPKTNIQILQQNVLLRQKYLVTFLRQHGREVFPEVRTAYIDTLSKVLSAHFRSYLAALERMQARPRHVWGSNVCLSPALGREGASNVEGWGMWCWQQTQWCMSLWQGSASHLVSQQVVCAGGCSRTSRCAWRGACQRCGGSDGQLVCTRDQHSSRGCLCPRRARQHPAPSGTACHHPACCRVGVQEGTRRGVDTHLHSLRVLQKLHMGGPRQSLARWQSMVLVMQLTQRPCSVKWIDTEWHQINTEWHLLPVTGSIQKCEQTAHGHSNSGISVLLRLLPGRHHFF